MHAQRQGHRRRQPTATIVENSHQTSTLLAPWSWNSSFHNCEQINFYCLSSQFMIFCYSRISRQKGDGMLNMAAEGNFRGWRLKAESASLWRTFNNHTGWTSRSGRGLVGNMRLGLPLSIASFGSQISSPVKRGDGTSFSLSSFLACWKVQGGVVFW